MSEGWVKIHRKLLDNPIVCKDCSYLAVWIFLLLNATHKEIPVIFNGEKMALNQGQLITCLETMAQTLHISKSKANRIIQSLKSEKQIETLSKRHGTLVTIVNWVQYQSTETPVETPVEHQRNTSGTPVERNKNVKNDQECKNEIFFNAFWAAYPNKKAKKDAIKAFAKLEMTENLLQEIITAVNLMKETRNWQEGFVPHPATYLNGERWKDEIPMKGGNNGTNNGKPRSDNAAPKEETFHMPGEIRL